jgi:hypothetical protein
MADGVSELERQLNELTGALDLLFELRDEFAQWVEEAADGSKREACRKRSWPYRSIRERISEAPRRTAEEGEVSLTVHASPQAGMVISVDSRLGCGSYFRNSKLREPA